MTAAARAGSPRLSRHGFLDVARAARILGKAGLGLWDETTDVAVDEPSALVVSALGRAGDPDLAVRTLERLVAAADRDELLSALGRHAGFRGRLTAVLGASTALGDHLVAVPQTWRRLLDDRAAASRPSAVGLRRDLLSAVGADPDDPPRGSGGTPAAADSAAVRHALRRAYRGALVDLAGRDLTGALAMEDAAGELADLAAATLGAALSVALAGLGPDPAGCRLAVIGLGKCGGRELNYVSDVDVVFVAEPDGHDDVTAALATATRLCTAMMTICAEVAWPVDAALRPEGKAGALVRTLAGHAAYYHRWARTWEFQALLKMRPVAGDVALGAAYVDELRPLVWTAGEREHFVADVQAMRRRVEETLPSRIAPRELKLGPGGLRDIEFAVQLLQLVHGRADDTLHSGTTLSALQALRDGGYVGRTDADTLAASYRFLRTVEHRLQLQRLRRTHLLPDTDDEWRWLARALGFRPDARGSAVDVLHAELALHVREVRRLHEKLFYRPLLAAVARVPGEELRLTPAAARGRLAALGFIDPDGALRHIEALTAGMSRTAALQRMLLPAMLRSFADAPTPDAGLLAYRQVSELLGATPWFLRLLRDGGTAAQRLAVLLGTSRYVADLLGRAPEALRVLGDDEALRPRDLAAVHAAMRSTVTRHKDPALAVTAVRGLRRHELVRIASADLLEHLDVAQVSQALSDVAAATLQAALDVSVRTVESAQGPLPTRFTVVAMGRLGGAELGYGSDADVVFVHDPLPGADDQAAAAAALAVAEGLRRLLALPAQDPPLLVDADLRPEGRNGPLVRTLASYREYYDRWGSIWERQALLRAAPIAGDLSLGAAFLELIEPLRYPAGGISAADATEIRRIKARVDAERLPRGADPATHTKLGRGGLGDIEWTVQLMQLMYAGRVSDLRTPSTLAALRGATVAGLVQPDDAAALEAAWRLATRSRNAIMLVRGRAADQLPHSGRDLVAVARAVGYPADRDSGVFLDDYRRAARRARAVVERLFYAS